jgi:hypothetical protein
VATCKDAPIPRCGGNQQGNLRNEGRPCAAMTGPGRAGDKTTGPRYRGHPTSMGDGFAGEHGLVEKDLFRGEAHIAATTRCSMDVWGGDRSRTVNFRSLLRHHRASHVHHSAAHRGRLNLALSELSSYRSVIAVALENLIRDCWSKVEWVTAEFLSATVRTRAGSVTC